MQQQPVRILLVEDEFITRDNLREALEDMGYLISGEAMRAEQAIAILEKGETDIAILDIRLKGELTGIWVGGQIQQQYGIPFIYLTAFGDQATIKEATQTQPAAYLAKPFSPTNIYAAIELAIQNHQAGTSEGTSGNILDLDDLIFVKEELTYRRIKIRDILYFQSFRNYLEIITKDGKFVLRSTMSNFSKRLPPHHFFQPHRSFLINLAEVTEIGGNFVLLGNHEVSISQNLRKELISTLELYN